MEKRNISLSENVNSLNRFCTKKERSGFYLPQINGSKYIATDEIIYCQASSNYSFLHTKSKNIKCLSKTLKWLAQRLPQDKFVRIHQSYLVNRHAITHCNTTGRRPSITLSNGIVVPISRARKNYVSQVINHTQFKGLKKAKHVNFVIAVLMLFSSVCFSQGVGIGTNSPESSAMLDITSPNKGLLIPRTDTSLVSNPATGLMIFSNASKSFYFYNGSSWDKVGESPWTKVPQTDEIEYIKPSPLVRVAKANGDKTQMDGSSVVIKKNGGNNTVLSDHTLSYDEEFLNGQNAIVSQEITKLDKDSLTFSFHVVSGLLSGYSKHSREEINFHAKAGAQSNSSYLSPNRMGMDKVLGSQRINMDLDFEKLSFTDDNIGLRSTKVSLDSISLFSQTGLLLPELAVLRPYGLSFKNLNFESIYNNTGFTIRERLSPSDIFKRIELVPDQFRLINDTKWEITSLGMNPINQSGELKLSGGTGLGVHTYIGADDLDGSIMEMNFKGNLRVGMWSFEHYGLVNTLGGNGFINTFVGTAQMHNNPNFGGMGVMDDEGNIKAGMEVNLNKEGMIYSKGSIIVKDDNENQRTRIDSSGYKFLTSNEVSLVSLGKDLDVLGGAGFISLQSKTEGVNFIAGSNVGLNGNAENGFAGVYDNNNTVRAGMAVTDDDKGHLFGDNLTIGKLPQSNNIYPFNLLQTAGFGLNMQNITENDRWELYISSTGNLELYKEGFFKGSFNSSNGVYTTGSDKRLKTNISQLDSQMSKLNKLTPTKYNFKANNPLNKMSIGFIAQDVAEVFPDLVTVNDGKKANGMLSVDYNGLIVVSIKAIQEQQDIIDTQQVKMDQLEKRLSRLETLLIDNGR